MQAKLKLLIAMSHDADLLILDEPTLGLDVMSREAMLEELQEYLDSEGTGGAPRSVLISSHISSDLEKFCDDIYMIDRGRIVLHGETDVLLDSYGILKVDERQYQALDRRYLLAGMREAYGYRLLTNERRYYRENYPDLVMEKGSIDDILILTARGRSYERIIDEGFSDSGRAEAVFYDYHSDCAHFSFAAVSQRRSLWDIVPCSACFLQ